MFLAFPAILLASLTMVAEEEGPRQALDDARGALLGTFGMIGFGVLAAFTVSRWPAPVPSPWRPRLFPDGNQ